MKGKIDVALSRLDAAIEKLKPVAVYGLFSGGHDSFSSTYIASLHPQFCGAIHVNTGIGVQATRDYVRTTCRDRGWLLRELKASENTKADGTPDPMIYENIVMKYGFPGPAWQNQMYIMLKSRILQAFEREQGFDARTKNKRRVLYVTGCRSQESDRRMGTTKEVSVGGRSIWVNPIHDWSKLDTTLLLQYAEQQRNPIVDLIHKSGECLCGAFAKKGELEELAMWPETRPAYDEIVAIQEKVKAVHAWGWGERPPRAPKSKCRLDPNQMMLCWACMK